MRGNGVELWTREQVAEFIGIPESEVRRWAVRNEVFMSTYGDQGVRYARKDVERAKQRELEQ